MGIYPSLYSSLNGRVNALFTGTVKYGTEAFVDAHLGVFSHTSFTSILRLHIIDVWKIIAGPEKERDLYSVYPSIHPSYFICMIMTIFTTIFTLFIY